MTVIDQLLKANERYAKEFTKGDLPMPPGRKVAILTCMDARIEPGRALGIEEGDAHVIRNAGGRVSEGIRSLVISQQLLGTEEVAVDARPSDAITLALKADAPIYVAEKVMNAVASG